MNLKELELSADQVWNPCRPDLFEFDTTDSLSGQVAIFGQERAVRAMDFGVGITSRGFNVYAMGQAGTGRTTTTNTFLDRLAAQQPVPNDWAYVYNFEDPNQPNALSLPPGRAMELRRDMQELVDDLLREIPRAFASKEYENQRQQIVRTIQTRTNEQFAKLEQQVNEQGFTLIKTAMGMGIAPVLNGQVLNPEAYQQLDAATRQQIEERQQALQGEIADTMRQIRELEKETKQQLQAYDREIADFAVGHLIQELKDKYAHLNEVPAYLQAASADIINHVEGFKAQEEEGGNDLNAAMRTGAREALLKRYQVNVLVDNSALQGAPVVFEPNPSHGNLIGRTEHRAEFGALVTDFTMIKAGALHKANGGYLVLEMHRLAANPLAWDALKRSLKSQRIRTEEIASQLQAISTVTLEPEPIPLDVKVVLIGDPMTYYLLHEYDEDFRKLFKVQADFGTDFDRTPDTCQQVAQFIAARCQEEKLLSFDRLAVARVVEYSSRLADHQRKLSTKFGRIADLLREADYWARRRNADTTTAEDVQKAIDEQVYRANRVEDELQEVIDDGTLRVDVTGEVIGQVNGLSVMGLGGYSFGKPSRITAQTFTGRSGVVSLDREAKLSGRLYDKGLLTLTGYLGAKYASRDPLSLSASISFEQMHDEIDGDSASSTELYALLSSLSRLPIKQGIAVTGAVDQQGNIQPVGGLNEKIEGHFVTCQNRGLTGDQGVILPAQNVPHLMLRAEVRQAMDEGTFHIYAVRTVDQGIEILTGVAAGEMQDDGTYPEDSVHGRVMVRLSEIADNLKDVDEDEEEEDGSDGGEGEGRGYEEEGDEYPEGEEPEDELPGGLPFPF